jgi:hypothetical protein
MRIYEFANAEEQLTLLRTIIDNTWTAIAQQAEQQKRSEAERKAKSKFKPGSKKSSKGKILRIPATPPPPNKKPQTTLVKQPPLPLNKSNSEPLNAVKPVTSINSHLIQQPIGTAIKPKLASLPVPLRAVSPASKPSGIYSAGTPLKWSPSTQDSTPVQQSSSTAAGMPQAKPVNANAPAVSKPKPNLPLGGTLLARERGVVDDAV